MGSLSLLFPPQNAPSAPLLLPPVGTAPSNVARPRLLRIHASSRGDGPSAPPRPDVVVTRERGKNAKLVNALAKHNVHCLEFPLVKHIEGPDMKRLPSLLRESRFDWIVITSPEAASVFLDSWSAAGSPKVRIAVVGSGTAAVFNKVMASPNRPLEIAFSPSKATGKILSLELPKCDEGDCSVLYPASVKAGNEIEEGLTYRGFKVKRLNTYSTVAVDNVDQKIFRQAFSAPVLAVASPSALRAWISFIPKLENWDNSVACIGETTAFAAKRLGLKRVYHPENPGFEGWVESILEALRAHDRLPDV